MKVTLLFLTALIFISGCNKESPADKVAGRYLCINIYDYWNISGMKEHREKTDTLFVTKIDDNVVRIDPDYDITSCANRYDLNEEFGFKCTYSDGIPQVYVKFTPSVDSLYFYSTNGGLGGRSTYRISGKKF